MLNGNGRVNEGEIHITLGDPDDSTSRESFILRPTMRAADLISNQLGGFAKARQAILDENRAAIVFIIRVGTAMNDKDARRLPDMVWKNGINLQLLMPIMEYLAVLNNGGRPLSPEDRAIFRVIDGDSEEINLDDDRQKQIDHYEEHNQGNG